MREGGKVYNINTYTWARWSKPEVGWLKLNTDGSFGGEGALSRCGGLLRDSNGQWIRGFAKAMVVSSSLAAEMWALREGLTLCLDMLTQAVEIELDVSAAISFISGNSTLMETSLALLMIPRICCCSCLRLRCCIATARPTHALMSWHEWERLVMVELVILLPLPIMLFPFEL